MGTGHAIWVAGERRRPIPAAPEHVESAKAPGAQAHRWREQLPAGHLGRVPPGGLGGKGGGGHRPAGGGGA